MSIGDLTRDAVLAAVREYDEIGRDAFLRTYGFRPAREYFLLLNGQRYDSKAIAGVAHRFARPDVGALRPSHFSGGEDTVAHVLERLGFAMERPDGQGHALPELKVGQVYTWDELSGAFGFNPSLFTVGGGMLSRPEFNALLLITHPGGARSFDYEDRWDGDTLIYTGRGKTGNQRLDGPNRDVAENRKRLIVLEAAGAKQLKYLGEATCRDHWTARAPDDKGHERNVWKFRLAFDQPVPASAAPLLTKSRSVLRQPRPFRPDQPSATRVLKNNRRATPEETAALQEKANREHRGVLVRLAELLAAAGWTKVEEIPAAVDLWATDGAGRVLFEVKTLSGSNEIHQCRAALSQLLEYRFFYGDQSDRLCVVVDGPIADRRRALLENYGVAVLVIDGTGIAAAIGQLAQEWFGRKSFPPFASL